MSEVRVAKASIRHRYQKKGILGIEDVEPITEKQRELINAINTYSQTFVLGPAGTGKTYVTARMASSYLARKDVAKIVVTRPNISASKSLGFFPGTLEEKFACWTIPIIEVLKDTFGDSHVENMLKRGVVEPVPFETMRGRTFDNSFIILDEAQNVTFHEMQMFLTRTGEYSKVVISGDVRQSDIREKDRRMTRILDIIRDDPQLSRHVGIVEFGVDDVVRSGITKLWINAFYG